MGKMTPESLGQLVGDRQVGIPVAVEIAHRDRRGAVTSGDVGRWTARVHDKSGAVDARVAVSNSGS